MTELKDEVKSFGIDLNKMSKTQIIQSIMKAEGKNPCFSNANDQCPDANCYFMENCPTIKCKIANAAGCNPAMKTLAVREIRRIRLCFV